MSIKKSLLADDLDRGVEGHRDTYQKSFRETSDHMFDMRLLREKTHNAVKKFNSGVHDLHFIHV